ncbi:MAG: hypothetical protein JW780_01985 [Clostridiales bacterium]|nr:hypothetical protein [Clostridiales bacterium]
MNKWSIARKIIVYAVYIVLFSSVQVTFSSMLSMNGQVADLMLVFVVVTGYLFGVKDAIVVGLITGLMRDYFSGPAIENAGSSPSALFGLGMLMLLYAGILSAVLFSKAFHRKLPLAFVQVMIITLVYKIIGHIIGFGAQRISGTSSEYLSLYEIFVNSILTQMFLNLLAAVPIIVMIRYLGPYKNGVNLALIEEMDAREGSWQIG